MWNTGTHEEMIGKYQRYFFFENVEKGIARNTVAKYQIEGG